MTTRRTLLTAGAVASALPSSLLAAALEDSSDALETWQQVIVIGSGLAGLTAGASALESGARRVLILEKGPLVGGHSLYSSGSIAAVGRIVPEHFQMAGATLSNSLWLMRSLWAAAAETRNVWCRLPAGPQLCSTGLKGSASPSAAPLKPDRDFIRAAGQCRAILPDGAMFSLSWTAIGVWAGKQSSRRRLKRLNGRNRAGRSA